MSIELNPDGSGGEFVIGFEGEYTIADVRRFLEQFDTGTDIDRLELTLATDDRLSLRLPISGDDTEIEGNPAPVETSARVQRESVPFDILSVLEASDTALRTEEIYDRLEVSDLSQNAIASRLWNLYKRGLVDKEAYPDDNRQKVYSLTGRGVYALDEARNRT